MAEDKRTEAPVNLTRARKIIPQTLEKFVEVTLWILSSGRKLERTMQVPEGIAKSYSAKAQLGDNRFTKINGKEPAKAYPAEAAKE